MAKILSLHELSENKVIYYESKDGKIWVAEIVSIKDDEIVFSGCANEVHVNPKNYGTYYRCWSGKPAKWQTGHFWN